MRLLQKMKEVLMFGPLNQVEQRLEASLTTKEAIVDVSTHLIQLLAKHEVTSEDVPTLHEFRISFWTKKLPGGKIAIDQPTIVNSRKIGGTDENSYRGRQC